jgi:organic hydroperoxide reductase OsmC/OhrA
MAHEYTSAVIWTGNRGNGTSSYRAYDRTWDVAVPGKAVIHCSNDPLLGGDPTKMNPEDLLLSALSACHMLWYLHYASEAKVVVTAYEDSPVGIGEVEKSGAGRFTAAILRPRITVLEGTDIEVATAIHHRIHEVCFIARSVNFPVSYEPTFVFETKPES